MGRKGSKPTRRYDRVELTKRKRLVQDVIEGQRSISKTAKRLGIKLSTAKLILRRFKTTGTYYETDLQRRQREEKERIEPIASLSHETPVQEQEEEQNQNKLAQYVFYAPEFVVYEVPMQPSYQVFVQPFICQMDYTNWPFGIL